MFDESTVESPKSRPSAVELLQYDGMKAISEGKRYTQMIKNYISRLPKKTDDIRHEIRETQFEDELDVWS